MYLADSINRAADVGTRRSLRSSSSTAVVVPVTRRSTIGDRALPVAAASLLAGVKVGCVHLCRVTGNTV